mgnify:CR=1 FL=1
MDITMPDLHIEEGFVMSQARLLQPGLRAHGVKTDLALRLHDRVKNIEHSFQVAMYCFTLQATQ